MAKKTKSATKRKGTARRAWSKEDLKLLRSEAGKTPVQKLARKLKRSAAATALRASILKLSLRVKKK
jgi:hypothetical protein